MARRCVDLARRRGFYVQIRLIWTTLGGAKLIRESLAQDTNCQAPEQEGIAEQGQQQWTQEELTINDDWKVDN
jgi:hypothetical protein